MSADDGYQALRSVHEQTTVHDVADVVQHPDGFWYRLTPDGLVPCDPPKARAR